MHHHALGNGVVSRFGHIYAAHLGVAATVLRE